MKKGVVDFIEKLFDEFELCELVECMFSKVCSEDLVVCE